MEENMQTAQIIVIAKKIWPTTERIIKMTIYTIFNFLKTSVQYMLDQVKNI